MDTFLPLPTALHQAAVTGKVVDARTQAPVSGVSVTITAMPAAFTQVLALRALAAGAGWEGLGRRPDRTRTASDGCFRFVDLPDGAYTLSFAIPHGERRYGTTTQAFTVARDATTTLIPLAVASIALPPTGAVGLITDSASPANPLPMAHVRVQGSGERAYADANGNFYLTGVFPGPCTLEITAPGFAATPLPTATIVAGQVINLGSFALTAVTPPVVP